MQKVYAHRGASGSAPENTMRAFQLAAEMKADGVELDVQRTRDGKLVVFHDEELERVTDGYGFIAGMTYEELKQWPITKATNAHGNDGIPLLSEVLEFLKKNEMCVNIEIKNSRLLYPGIEKECLLAVKICGMEKQTIFSSFNHNSMVELKKLDPEAKCGFLYDAHLAGTAEYAQRNGVDALHPHFSETLLTPMVEVCHRSGLIVNAWTINEMEDIRKVVKTGVDGIITNYPERARAIIDGLR